MLPKLQNQLLAHHLKLCRVTMLDTYSYCTFTTTSIYSGRMQDRMQDRMQTFAWTFTWSVVTTSCKVQSIILSSESRFCQSCSLYVHYIIMHTLQHVQHCCMAHCKKLWVISTSLQGCLSCTHVCRSNALRIFLNKLNLIACFDVTHQIAWTN